MDKLADQIVELARIKLAEDSGCMGGLNAKIHNVFMELTLELTTRMEAERGCDIESLA